MFQVFSIEIWQGRKMQVLIGKVRSRLLTPRTPFWINPDFFLGKYSNLSLGWKSLDFVIGAFHSLIISPSSKISKNFLNLISL